MSTVVLLVAVLGLSFATTDATSPVRCPRSADIVLALDQSKSIDEAPGHGVHWDVHMRGFAKSIASAFPIDEHKTAIGLMRFSNNTRIEFHLNRYHDRQSVLDAIDNLNWDYNFAGETNIAASLRTAREVMFAPSNGARPGIPKIFILLTDGMANYDAQQTQPQADLAKDANIKIFTVGVTSRVNQDELRDIASQPDYFFYVPSFDQLNSALQSLIDKSCPGPDPEPCPEADADIVLALDQSKSIDEAPGHGVHWDVHMLGFAKSIASAFSIDERKTQFGLLKFSNSTRIEFRLNRYHDLQSVVGAIDNFSWDYNFAGETNIAAALRTAREVMFAPSNGARPGIPKIFILLTDGMANYDAQQTQPQADLAKQDNIKIFTVGVTSRVNQNELREIASKPEYFFPVSGFDQLNSKVHDVVASSCREAAPPART